MAWKKRTKVSRKQKQKYLWRQSRLNLTEDSFTLLYIEAAQNFCF